jgi:hypothetical protein
MANVITGNPWILDTAGVITTNPTSIAKIRYYPNAADNDLSIGHGDGTVVWVTRAIATASSNESTGQEEIVFDPPLAFSGFKVNTIDAGTVYVYVNSAL